MKKSKSDHDKEGLGRISLEHITKQLIKMIRWRRLILLFVLLISFVFIIVDVILPNLDFSIIGPVAVGLGLLLIILYLFLRLKKRYQDRERELDRFILKKEKDLFAIILDDFQNLVGQE